MQTSVMANLIQHFLFQIAIDHRSLKYLAMYTVTLINTQML